MLRCKFDKCVYPNCERNCDMDETKLIQYLSAELETARRELADLRLDVRLMTNDLAAKLSRRTITQPYKPTCILGYPNCVHDPAYIRTHYRDWWIKLGMPVKCSHIDKFEGGCFEYAAKEEDRKEDKK